MALPSTPVIPERFQPLVHATAELARRFEKAGRRLYVVGGPVRDAFAGDSAPSGKTDLDLTTDAPPDEVEQLVKGWADALWLQGKRFGTIGLRKGEQDFEITTHRAEVYPPDSRKPEVSFGDSIEVDLSRRDFTLNAMALRLPDLELVDPYDGLADLASHRLRTPLSAEVSFSDDPLRMLRAARFIAGFGLEPVPEISATIKVMHERLSIVSAERIRDELDKLVSVDKPSPGLWFIVETGLAEEFLPELPQLALEQDPIHRHKDVLAHTLAVVDKTGPDRLLRLAALLHDIGKPRTRAFGPGGVTFHHHEVVGARMARERLTALRYPHDEIEVITTLVELHLRFHTYRLGWTDRAVRRYVRDAGPLLDRLNELTRCGLHHAQRGAGPRPRAAHGRARGAHRRAAGARGARRGATRARRPPGHGAPRAAAGAGRGRGARLPPRAAARRGPRRRGGGLPTPGRVVGDAPPARGVSRAEGRVGRAAQSSG